MARIEYKPLYREAKQSAGMVGLGWGQAGSGERKWAGGSEDSTGPVSVLLGAVTTGG